MVSKFIMKINAFEIYCSIIKWTYLPKNLPTRMKNILKLYLFFTFLEYYGINVDFQCRREFVFSFM